MSDKKPEPSLTVEWTHDGYRDVAFWDASGMTPEALHNFAERVSERIMFESKDTKALKESIDRAAEESGLRAEYLTSGHDDPLQWRFGVTLRPADGSQ